MLVTLNLSYLLLEKAAITQSYQQSHIFQTDAEKFKVHDEDDHKAEAAKRRKKKKGLTEKDLDFEQEFDDDQDEDNVKDESDFGDDDDNLSEDGKKIQLALKEGDAEEQAQIQKPLNLNFTEHEADDDEEEKGDNAEDSDSSMASIFGDDDAEALPEVGTKRTFTKANTGVGNDSGDKKRKKLA